MARIRRYYRRLPPQADAYIVAAPAATLGIGRRRDRLVGFSSIAMMITTINGIVAGGLHHPPGSPRRCRSPQRSCSACWAAAVHLVLFYLYQRRRYRTRAALPDLPF